MRRRGRRRRGQLRRQPGAASRPGRGPARASSPSASAACIPRRCAVDTPRRQRHACWEPGETVDVRPTWRNVNGAAQTFGGTLASLTGPAGATYTHHRRRRRATARCANGAAGACTRLLRAWRVSNAGPRPALHWDATAVETLTPDTQGQQKRWRLHVGDSFTDVPRANPFYRFIETLLHHGVTGGCTATQLLPGQLHHARADGGVRAGGQGGRGLRCRRPARTPRVRRRARDQPLLPLHRGAGAPRRGERLRRRQLLPDAARSRASRWRCSCCARWTRRSTRRPARRRTSSTTCRRRARSAAGSRSWPGAAWSAAAAAATTARPQPVTREQMGVFIGVTFGLTLYGP